MNVLDENPLSFYPGIKDGSKLNLLVIKKAEEGSIQRRKIFKSENGRRHFTRRDF